MSFRATFIAAAILMAAIGAASPGLFVTRRRRLPTSPNPATVCRIHKRAALSRQLPLPNVRMGSWSFSEHPHKRRHMPRSRRRAAVFVAPSKAARGHILGTTWARIALRCDTLRYAFPQLDGGLTA